MLLNLWCKLQSQKGQGMVEYGLVIAFVALVALVGVKALGTTTSGFLSGIKFN